MMRYLAFSLLAFASLAHADRPRYQLDGTVRLGTKVFQNYGEYFDSAEFRARGKCEAESPAALAELATIAPAIAPGDCAMNATVINPEYNDDRTLIIQVAFHVIKRTDGVGDITPAMLQSQIDILNEDFNALPGTLGAMGTNAKVKFVMARYKPDGTATPGYEVIVNDTYFDDPGSGGGTNPMKNALNWDPARYLNVYTNDANGLLGYATFPQQSAGTSRDGVVVLWNSVGRNAPIQKYNLGRTLTHEIGHYLGLFHTFQGGCTGTAPYTTGDLIGDTVREQQANFGCTPAVSACGTGNNPIENYMDYSDDACMTKFTVEQSNRIRCAIINYRRANTEPKAMFTSAIDKATATFTSTSTDAETPTTLVHNWNFGDGTTSTEQNPVHVYANSGTYGVTLEVVDPGSGASKQMATVDVTVPPPPGVDAGGGGGGGDDEGSGGGCCDANTTGASYAALAFPVLLVLRRRRRARA
jgi:Pregnancy-associated plasma protein-A/PKD domain